jgi:hypothetical protein
MPPVGSPAGAAAFSGLSATTASVVRNSAAIDAAFCSAERVTLAGSMMPALNRSTYSPVAALRPCRRELRPFSRRRRLEAGVEGDLLQRSLERDATMLAPVASSPESSSFERLAGLDEGDATTGDDALLDGGLRVADGVLDAVLALLELDLGGRAALMTATPPASLARRSCSFSRS